MNYLRRVGNIHLFGLPEWLLLYRFVKANCERNSEMNSLRCSAGDGTIVLPSNRHLCVGQGHSIDFDHKLVPPLEFKPAAR